MSIETYYGATGFLMVKHSDHLQEVERLRAENERLQRFETAYKEFSDKTDWVRPNAAAHELGMHVADILRKRCDDLTSHNQAQADEILRLRKNADRYEWLRARDLDTIKDGGVFAGITPQNMVLNEETLDEAVDTAMAQEQQP